MKSLFLNKKSHIFYHIIFKWAGVVNVQYANFVYNIILRKKMKFDVGTIAYYNGTEYFGIEVNYGRRNYKD
jgi:hypothetical protein